MQTLARNGLTDQQVRDILTSNPLDASKYGVDVLDLDGDQIGELSGGAPGRRIGRVIGGGGDLVGCVVSHDVTLPVPGTIRMQTGVELDWPKVRARPWQEVNGLRFYLGVYGLETPTATPDEGIFDVQGYDLLAAFRVPMRRSRWLDIGVSYTAAARAWIDAMAIPGVTHRISSDADAVLTDAKLVWALNPSAPDLELDGIGDLMAAIGYAPLYPDEIGVLRAAPYRPPTSPEWTFDLRSNLPGRKLSITDVRRVARRDTLRQTNWWRGVRRDLANRPVEGAGLYTVDRSDGGLVVPAWGTYDVASQEALQAAVDAKVVTDTTARMTVELITDAMPQLGHENVVRLIDDDLGIDGLARIVKWDQDLANAEVAHTLGVL